MARKKTTPASKKVMFAPMSATPIALGVKKAQTLLRDDEPEEAYDLLQELNEKYPANEQILQELENAAVAIGYTASAVYVRRELIGLRPTQLADRERLGQLYLMADCPALAVREWRSAVEEFSDSPAIPKLRETLAKFEDTLSQMLAEREMTDADGFEDACHHEEIRLMLDSGKYGQARDAAKELLERRPGFVPARNNLAQAYFLDGDFDGAVATVNTVLEQEPENIHALSNLTRFLFLGGREQEAREMAARLKASTAPAASRVHKIMEPLAYLGDDEGILTAFREAYPELVSGLAANRPVKPTPQSDDDVVTWHLAATAFARTGNELAANQLWIAATSVSSPIYMLAGLNMVELDKPVGERGTPFFYLSREWLSGAVRLKLGSLMEAIVARDRIAEAVEESEDDTPDEPTPEYQEADARVTEVRRILRKEHPELITLFPHLLDRTEPQMTPVLIALAESLQMPEMFAALRDFGLGERGSDAARMQAVQAAVNYGVMDPGNVRFFRQGEWTELRFYGFEITGEPVTQPYAPEVQDLMMRGREALREEEYEEAERIYREALEQEPDARDLMNNLSFTLTRLGRTEEAEAMMDEILVKHPDYPIARINVALRKAREGDIPGARDLVDPLLSLRKFHITEFNSLCRALVEIALADDKKDEARSWLNLWLESGAVDENDPVIMALMFRVIDFEEFARQHGLGRQSRRAKKGQKRRGMR